MVEISLHDPITIISEKIYSNESKNSSIIDVPINATQVKLRAHRLIWSYMNDTVIDVKLDLSFDGGIKWIDTWIGFTSKGGIRYKPDNSLSEYSSVNRDIPEPKNMNRKLKARLSVPKDISIRTLIDVEFK